MKNHTYYLFTYYDDITNIRKFYVNNIDLDEKSYRHILIYYNGHVTIKDSKYVKIYSVNPLYLIFNKENKYFKEINGNKYLMLVPIN